MKRGDRYIPTASTKALHRDHHRSLDPRASLVSRAILIQGGLDRVEHGQHDSGLVDVVDISWDDSRIINNLLSYFKPVFCLIIHALLVTGRV